MVDYLLCFGIAGSALTGTFAYLIAKNWKTFENLERDYLSRKYKEELGFDPPDHVETKDLRRLVKML